MTDAELVSFAHEGVRISALLPPTWTASAVSQRQVRFFAPARREHADYRSTFSITLGEPEGFGTEWFQEFCDASVAALAQERPDFALQSTERFTLSSFVDVHAAWYTCGSEVGREFAQLQALGLMDRYHLYLINAATVLPLAEEYLPVFADVLRSLRMLPAR